VKVGSNNDHRDEHTTTDHTEDILAWAKRKISAVSESKPFRMAPLDYSLIEPEAELPASETEPKAVESTEVSTLNMANRLLVVELDEANPNKGKIHLLADDQEAGRLIEGLLDKGLAPGRLAALRGTRVSVDVHYRVAATIEHLADE